MDDSPLATYPDALRYLLALPNWETAAPGGRPAQDVARPRRLFELCFAPIARGLGWRPEFPFARIVRWCERAPDVHLIERRPMPPLGHFSLIRLGKRG